MKPTHLDPVVNSVSHSHRQAIQTKWFGATERRQARIRARCQAGSVYVNWDYGLGVNENHVAACKALLDRLGWQGHWIGGGSPDGRGEVFVQMPEVSK